MQISSRSQSTDVDVQQALRRREERLRQPAELGRHQFPDGEPDAERDQPGAVVHKRPAEAAEPMHGESEDENIAAADSHQIAKMSRAAPRR